METANKVGMAGTSPRPMNTREDVLSNHVKPDLTAPPLTEKEAVDGVKIIAENNRGTALTGQFECACYLVMVWKDGVYLNFPAIKPPKGKSLNMEEIRENISSDPDLIQDCYGFARYRTTRIQRLLSKIDWSKA